MRFPSSARAPRIGRPGPALLLASAALFAGGLTQSSWAVSLITGADVRDSSLTGKDVKDGSLGPSDLSRAARTALSGQVGPQGPRGETGPAGPAGATGPRGETGPPGPTGETGPSGPAGQTGPQGQSGPQGIAGAAGPKGDAGAKGEPGARGAQGPAGPQGEPGTPAADLWAAVKSSGDVVAASIPGPAVVTFGAGTNRLYRLAFDRSIRGCAISVTRQSQMVDDPEAATPITAVDEDLGGTAYTYFGELPTQLYVRLLSRDGSGTEGAFSVSLQCEPEAPGPLVTR
ncbi:MAG: collagen-like protein [Solirubrobacteraceae bacterium]|nr:collagen-like protein [Solirubrobacteraceae bacterium]